MSAGHSRSQIFLRNNYWCCPFFNEVSAFLLQLRLSGFLTQPSKLSRVVKTSRLNRQTRQLFQNLDVTFSLKRKLFDFYDEVPRITATGFLEEYIVYSTMNAKLTTKVKLVVLDAILGREKTCIVGTSKEFVGKCSPEICNSKNIIRIR